MRSGFYGVSLPHWPVLLALLGGVRRGLLWLSPVLVLTPLAWFAAFRRLPRADAVVLVAVPVCYLLINSGYFYWDGGGSTGPRISCHRSDSWR